MQVNGINVDAAEPSGWPGWVVAFPRDNRISLAASFWRERHREVEEVVKAALIGGAIPF